MTPEPDLCGRNVTLRPYAAGFSTAEVDRFLAWAADSEIVALSGGSRLDMSPERFRELFLERARHRNTDREQQFAVLDEAGELIGRTGLFGIDRRAGVSELGIVIGQKERWNRGYGRDAVAALCRHAFDDLELGRVVLYTFPDNRRAQRCFSAVGFRAVRKIRRFTLERGVHSEIEMELSPLRLLLPDETPVHGGEEHRADGHDNAIPSDGGVQADQPDVGGE
jgi:RimJ/RimL family protein N-acetyltransferase